MAFGFTEPKKAAAPETFDRDALAELLKTDPDALAAFEEAYRKASLSDEDEPKDVFGLNAKQASKLARTKEIPEFDEEKLAALIDRIVGELLASLENGGTLPLLEDGNARADGTALVTREEIAAFPKAVRPQLTGTMQTNDLGGPPSGFALLGQYGAFLKETDPRKKAALYGSFRQGLDVLDLDEISYRIIGKNRASIGYWFPALKRAVDGQDFFKTPETKIVRVPRPILQLTRLDYFSLTPSTLKIVDDFCMKAFDLDENRTYFVKTGVFSSKFDFRNAKVSGAEEVRQIGEYLLFVHHRACEMAGPLTGPVPIYGAATTNEWCVREYVEDSEGNPTIYEGLPLRTEYRAFVDFDADEVLGMCPYWRPDVMKARFGKGPDRNSPRMIHDYAVYAAREETLMKRYAESAGAVEENLKALVPKVDLRGQWSVDVMRNGDDFWIIDMAPAETSALRDCVPEGKLKAAEENWLPDLSGGPDGTAD